MSETKYKEFWIPKSYENEFHSGIHVIEYSALVEEKQKVKELVELLQKFNKKTDAYLKIYDGDKELFTYKIFANELIKKYGDV